MKRYKIENWTYEDICECKPPEGEGFELRFPVKVLESLRKLTFFREEGQHSQSRFALLKRVGIDETIFQSAHFSAFGFPHILEHSTLDFSDPKTWQQFTKTSGKGCEKWVLKTLKNAHLDCFEVESNPDGGLSTCSLLTGKRRDLHLSFFELPLRKGDYFLGRLFETPKGNFVTFPFVLTKEDALECVTTLQNIYVRSKKVSWKSFMKNEGAISCLSFLVGLLNTSLSADMALSGLGPHALVSLQNAFSALSGNVECEKCLYEGFTKEGWMYSFAPRSLPELHIYFDPQSRDMMKGSGSHRTTKGYISLFWLPAESVDYARFLGSPEWCVGINKRGEYLQPEDLNEDDVALLLRVIEGIQKTLQSTYDVAA